ncbi:TetR/AcrR family transcriptional regulator [Rhodococcus sp. MEB064]|uniref:TetR/AcrR family transcriptional regulator n=1 Tax=Rhodococcus sp. MEB064 TaxID=1587522 RepID=UPI0005AC30DB|nr:TetR/AcrR family transcriptional regulator [Rhodococcus sp. MEB064]KIQ16632.1 TetR family transcriptional regulator [Rhodococcus sp. MEB064]
METSGESVRRGRPRDPSMESRVYGAVVDVYWRTGWAGFTIDAVAKTGGVGRAAIYRRWPTKEDLLTGALEAVLPLVDPIDTGSLTTDLAELARQLLTGYRDSSGLIAVRVALDARVYPDLLEALTATISTSRFTAAREIVRRAVARGELPESTRTTLLLEMLTGAVLSRVLFAHDASIPTDDDAYVDDLVAAVLTSVQR